jgi:hypothetical protein
MRSSLVWATLVTLFTSTLVRAAEPVAAEPVAAEPPSPSSSDKNELQGVDGFQDCRDLDVLNEKEKKIWSSRQPATPYRYPTEETTLDAPWDGVAHAAGQSAALLTATLVPHVNAVLRDSTPEPGLSWPWSFPIGPASTCSRRPGGFDLKKYRPFRLMVEPGFVAGEKSIAVFLRPGLRFLYHPTSWFVALGGGVGSMFELTGLEPARASLSPEALIQFGKCCEPGYVTLSVRREIFFAGKTQLWFANVGFTYF